jgi:hypothetical protein
MSSESSTEPAAAAVEGGDVELHHASPPSPRPEPHRPAGLRNLPGFGASFGSGTLHRVADEDPAALHAGNGALDQDQAALDVRADDAEVLRGDALGAQMAGHLLVLEGLARILATAGRTVERCETDTPWVARRPPKFQRFMAPAKPLPVVVPVTSTNWPATKWSAVSSAPTGIMFSAATRNSAILRLGSTLATAKWPRSAFETFLTLAFPTPSCSAV